MIDFAQRFATADPASTPSDAPLPDEALALLDRVMTPRPPLPTAATPPVPPGPRRPSRFRIPGLAIVVPALVLGLVTLAAMAGWFAFSPATTTTQASPAPALEWGEYTSEGALVAESEAIVTATTLDLGILDDGGLRYYVATVRVNSAATGPFAPGTQLEVAFPDPEPGEADWPPGLKRGERALLFLRTQDALLGSDLVNPTQGSYRLTDTSSVPEPHPENPLILDDTFLDRMGLENG